MMDQTKGSYLLRNLCKFLEGFYSYLEAQVLFHKSAQFFTLSQFL